MTTTPVAVTNTPNLDALANIFQKRDRLSGDFLQQLEVHAGEFLAFMCHEAGDFLHKLDVNKHSEDEVRATIHTFPSALSLINDQHNRLPIQSAMWNPESTPFVPLLAEEGVQLNVGGEGQRGGLLVVDPFIESTANILELLSTFPLPPYHDFICLDALKRLRDLELFHKEDIRQYNLLGRACEPLTKTRFDYLAEWDPGALTENEYNNGSLIHAATCAIDTFSIALEAGLVHYPQELGFLFQKDSDGDTAFELVTKACGQDEAWKAVDKCLGEMGDREKIMERNDVTNMYPFMLAAAGDTGELNVVYYLLRRNFDYINQYYSDRNRKRKQLWLTGEHKDDIIYLLDCSYRYGGQVVMAVATCFR